MAIVCTCAVLAHASPVLAPNDSLALRRAEQDMFRSLAERMAPYIVQIETVGGAQPRADQDVSLRATGNLFEDLLREEKEEDAEKEKRNPFKETIGSRFLLADGPTTGIIYSADGLILTSSFNFVREPAVVTVKLGDGRQFVADVVARDQVRKLALLRIDADDLPTPTWTPREQMHVGQWAVALGHGFGQDLPSITAGIVSALVRMHGNAIQTDAKLSPFNYGGPLVDRQGRILGICVPMAQRPGELAGVEFYDAGIGFAMPHWRVEQIVADLRQGRSFYRGWLGMVVDPQIKGGVGVKAVADPSPLHDVGVGPDDVIVSINGKPLRHFRHLVQSLYMLPAGTVVDLVVKKGDREIGFQVPLARSDELGPLAEDPEPFDPSDPYHHLRKDDEDDGNDDDIWP